MSILVIVLIATVDGLDYISATMSVEITLNGVNEAADVDNILMVASFSENAKSIKGRER